MSISRLLWEANEKKEDEEESQSLIKVLNDDIRDKITAYFKTKPEERRKKHRKYLILFCLCELLNVAVVALQFGAMIYFFGFGLAFERPFEDRLIFPKLIKCTLPQGERRCRLVPAVR